MSNYSSNASDFNPSCLNVPDFASSHHLQLLIRTIRNKTLYIDIDANESVLALKHRIEGKYNVPCSTQQLFYEGQELNDKRTLSTYNIAADSTFRRPLLLTQKFKISVFVSKKVQSLHSLIVNDCHNKLRSQNTIQCTSTTTVKAVIQKLNLIHLQKMDLLKVCVGADGTEDVTDYNQKILNVPGLLKHGILTMILCDKWFVDRSVDIAQVSSLMVETVQKVNAAAKLIKNSATFKELQYEYSKTKSFTLETFIEIDNMLIEQCHYVYRANKWIIWIIEANNDDDCDTPDEAQEWLNELQNKIQDINDTLRNVKRRWSRKSKQIEDYLEIRLKKTEYELMKNYELWTSSDIVQWLQYIDESIIFNNKTIKRFESSSVNGCTLSQINELILSELFGVDDANIRKLVIYHIDKLLNSNDDEKKEHDDNDNSVCCICVTSPVETAIVDCGHMVYCRECSKKTIYHYKKCPVCRTSVSSIINVYKSGLHFSEC